MSDDIDEMHISAELSSWATAPMECWKCRRETKVTVLLAHPPVWIRQGESVFEEDGALIVKNLPVMPDRSMQELRSVNVNVWLDDSRTVGSSYLMNHCQHCGTTIGDHYVGALPGPFLPLEDDGLALIQLISMKEPLDVVCGGYSSSSRLDDILNYESPSTRAN